jgi:hypothetical protein
MNEEENCVLEIDLGTRKQDITIYFRDGRYYWTIKSCGFDTFDKALEDVMSFGDLTVADA